MAKDDILNYIRVGTDYFKIIAKQDRYGIDRKELKKWNKQEIQQDFGRNSVFDVPKYDDFIMVPDNVNYKERVNNCFNMYKPFAHKTKKGSWKWTKILLEHVFEDQFEIGLQYIQILYLYPKQALPVLALVSKVRVTGKSTFLDWLTTLFGQNMVIVDAKHMKSDFNAVYATANIIGIEETFIDKTNTIEKIKAISTQKTMTVNMKMIQHFSVPFFGKIVMNSNNEDKFIKIDQNEIRFFVRKLALPKIKNHKILEDMVKEIPAFLYHLKKMPVPDFSQSRMVFTTEQLDNASLKKVKEESKSWLYKDLVFQFKEFFDNNQMTKSLMWVSPIDVKKKYYHNNHQVQLSYIKSVLKEEFNFKKSDKIIRYSPFLSETSKVGTPYLVPKEIFTSGEDPENKVEYDDLPF